MPVVAEVGALVAERYRLERQLGRGGMATVWRARHEVTGRRYALKLIAGADGDDQRLRRSLREARAASQVEHPHVVEVIDAFVSEGTPVIVMEMLEGESLAERLAREGALPLEQAAAILLQVASAVGALHEHGIVHRDLKPANVFLVAGGPTPMAKVLDFGIAKLSEPGFDLTTTGGVLGTPAYMAPEQHRGAPDIDHRADIWSLGVILYEVLSGERPLQGRTVAEVIERLVVDGVPPLGALAPDAPLDVAVMARRMLARDPADRPADLREVSEVLGRHTAVAAPTFGAPACSAGGADSSRSSSADIAPAHARETPQTARLLEDTLQPAEHSLPARLPRTRRLLWLLAIGMAAATIAWSQRESEPALQLEAQTLRALEAPHFPAADVPPFADAAPSSTSSVSAPFASSPRPVLRGGSPATAPSAEPTAAASSSPAASKPGLIDKARF